MATLMREWTAHVRGSDTLERENISGAVCTAPPIDLDSSSTLLLLLLLLLYPSPGWGVTSLAAHSSAEPRVKTEGGGTQTSTHMTELDADWEIKKSIKNASGTPPPDYLI